MANTDKQFIYIYIYIKKINVLIYKLSYKYIYLMTYILIIYIIYINKLSNFLLFMFKLLIYKNKNIIYVKLIL